MPDLSTTYLGLSLRSPLVASPSPLTGRLDSLRRLQDAGVGAVVLPSLFEEEVEAEEMALLDRMEAGSGSFGEASDYFPQIDLPNLKLDRQLRLTEEAAGSLEIPVIASVNGYSAGGWVHYARQLEDAGAKAIELNMYDVVVDPEMSSLDVEHRYLDLVMAVCAEVSVPVAVKLSPYFTSMANFAKRVVLAGAQGLVLFNRFYQPDLDLDTLGVYPRLNLSSTWEVRLPLRWIGILRPHLPTTSLALTGGAHRGIELAKGLLVGADIVMTTSAVLADGPGHAATMLGELSEWMTERDYESVDQMRGSVSSDSAQNPHAFERAQYIRVLASWEAGEVRR